jgi:hypothetical protein
MSIDHRAEAERILNGVLNENDYPGFDEGEGGEKLVLAALVHANLARNEEQAARTADMRDALRLLRGREYDVRKLVSTHIAKALASREPNRWKAGLELAKALDMADSNMDDAIDARLSDDGWDPRSAWKTPAALVPSDDPWVAKPDITAEVPHPVQLVIAGHLAEALLDNSNEGVQRLARGIAYELKNVGADLTEAIKTRIHEMTLGRDPSDPPF